MTHHDECWQPSSQCHKLRLYFSFQQHPSNIESLLLLLLYVLLNYSTPCPVQAGDMSPIHS